MTPAFLLAAKALPWRYIVAAGLALGLVFTGLSWYSSKIDDATKAGFSKAQALCEQAAKDAQTKADERLALQREQANTAVADALLTASEYETKLKRRQNELRKVSANLAHCVLSRDVVRVLNDARKDAIGDDRPAAVELVEPMR